MHIQISLPEQRLRLFENSQLIFTYPICSAKAGPGEEYASGCTPRGRHLIRAKIGAGAPVNSVFVGRRPTGEIFTPEDLESQPERDWILTRILWLSGLEPGFNRLGLCDTMRRYIYIHGSPDALMTPEPSSHGCIRMKSSDIIQLFDQVSLGTEVEIEG